MRKQSYKKLWKLLIDRDLKKKDLQKMSGFSSATIVKLANHEPVSMDVIIRVCDALDVNIEDIFELVSEEGDV